MLGDSEPHAPPVLGTLQRSSDRRIIKASLQRRKHALPAFITAMKPLAIYDSQCRVCPDASLLRLCCECSLNTPTQWGAPRQTNYGPLPCSVAALRGNPLGCFLCRAAIDNLPCKIHGQGLPGCSLPTLRPVFFEHAHAVGAARSKPTTAQLPRSVAALRGNPPGCVLPYDHAVAEMLRACEALTARG